MFTYKQATSKLAQVKRSFIGSKPEVFHLVEEYVRLTNKDKKKGLLYNFLEVQRTELRKEIGRQFMVSEKDFLDIFFLIPANSQALVDLLDIIFICDYINDERTRIRYEDLQQVMSEFQEIIPNVYLYENKRAVKFVLAVSGRCIEMLKGKGYEKTIVEDMVVKMRYKNGEEVVIFDGEDFYGNFQTASVLLDKGYLRFSLGNDNYFRVHALIMLLTYGEGVMKHALGHNSILTVDHRDESMTNNQLTNLQIVTRKDNKKLAIDNTHKALDFLSLPFKQYKPLRAVSGVKVNDVCLITEQIWEGILC